MDSDTLRPCGDRSASTCGVQDHTLKPFNTDGDGYTCDLCEAFGGEHRFAKGASMMSCRECDYDICKKCYDNQKAFDPFDLFMTTDFDPSEIEHGESCHMMIAACSSSHKP
jgi:hypothetical protein